MSRLLPVCVAFCLLASAFAQYGRVPDLEPKTYASPSGRYALWVNPSEPVGSGSAHYRLTLDRRVVWEKEFPFTWRDAAVADDGTSCGYAYTEGVMREGDFVVAILGSDGALRLDERHKREPSRYLHTNPNPKVAGWFMDAENDRMVVRIPDPNVNQQGETWWIYSLADGRRREMAPTSLGGPVRWLVDAKPLPGTPLSVMHWYRFDTTMGSTFSLMDPLGNSVWRWDVPDDYESGKPDRERFDLRGDVFEAGAILDTRRPGWFEIRLGRAAQRVTFKAEARGAEWSVEETARAPFVAPLKPEPAKLKVPTIQLEVVRKFDIPVGASATGPIHDVGEFHIVSEDRFVFLRLGEKPAICLVDGAGTLLRETPLPEEAGPYGRAAALGWIGGTEFVLVASGFEEEPTAKAWRVDALTGALRRLEAFKSFDVQAVAAAKDGSFAVLATEMGAFTMSDHLTFFDPEGRRLWDLDDGGGYSGEDGELLSPEDLVFDATGQLVVLDNIRHSLQFYGRDGKFQKLIDLDAKWNREMSYPTQLTALEGGGFLIVDSFADKPCVEIDASGSIVREVAPAYPNGKKVETLEDMRVDSKGRAWVTNGELFLCLDAKGIVRETVGSAPPESGLLAVQDLFVAPEGAVFALARDTMEVHAFTPELRADFTAKPLASDFDDRPDADLEVTRSGDLYVSGGTGGGLLHFSPMGKRVGFQPYPEGEERGPEGPFPMKPTWRWWGSGLLDETGREVAVLRRWPDQTWMLGGPDAVAPSGELMAYSGGSWREEEADRKLAFFKPDGTPESQVTMPEGLVGIYGCAFDGTLCYFATDEGVVAVDRKGKALWIAQPEGWTAGWEVFASREGIALWDRARTVTWVRVSPPPRREFDARRGDIVKVAAGVSVALCLGGDSR